MNDERSPDTVGEDRQTDINLGSLNSGETKPRNPRDLDAAGYAALDCRVHSDEARALVAAVADRVAKHELATGTRTNKRKAKQTDLSLAVEALLADLLLAQTSERSKGYVYRPMRPAGFTDGDVSYRVFRALVDALGDLGLIETQRGFRNSRESFDGQKLPMIQKATRFRATQRLLDLCEQHGVPAADFHQHFLIPLPENPLQLRASSRRNEFGDKIKGKRMRYEATAQTERMGRQLKGLNAFFDRFELRGGTHRGYIRVFNNGDDPKFKWNMGGRLYSHPESNYQQMASTDRLRMTINDNPVCEIDIRASYLTIFHALYDEQLDPKKDPYDVPGLGPEARDVVKMWVTASFGNNARLTKWPREVVKKYREKHGHGFSKNHSASKVGEKVMQKFPLLARLGEGERGGWAQLMFIESQAMLETMLELMREEIPSLAVHDSIIVPGWAGLKAMTVLKTHYKAFAKVTPVLKIKPEKYGDDQFAF